MEYILIDKFLMWQLENERYSRNYDLGSQFDLGLDILDDNGIEEVEDHCGIEYHGINEYEINKQLNLDDYYLYKIVDKGKFLFAAMKYNLNYTFVYPKLMS
jgi:hypothetical protein